MEPSQETKSLLAAAEGDPAAAAALLERHREPLRRMLALRMDRALGRRVDASDIVQEVLLDAHRRLAEYLRNPAMPFHLWLRHLARDRLVDAHRRHRLAQRRSLDREQPLAIEAAGDRSGFDLAAQLGDRGLTPAAAALRAEFQQRFLAALEQLPEADREVLVMRHVEQLANSEVAELLSLSAAAAAMRYLRAMRRLRAVLGEAASSAGPP